MYTKYIEYILARSTSLRYAQGTRLAIRKNTRVKGVSVLLLLHVVYHERAERVEWKWAELTDKLLNILLQAFAKYVSTC